MSEEIVQSENQPANKAVKNNLKMFLIGIGGLLIVAILVCVGVGMYRVYKVSATDKFTMGVAKVLRLAAAKAGDKVILYSDYVSDMRAIRLVRDNAKAQNNPDFANLTDNDLSDQVLWRAVSEILLNKEAMALGVKLTDEEVNNEKKTFLSDYATTQEAEDFVKKSYGWTLDQFTEKFIRPYALRNKLDQAIAADETKKQAATDKAQKVMDEINGGLSFDDAVKKYSEDLAGRENGGVMTDIDLVQLQSLQPQIAAAVATVKAGEVVKELVPRDYGLDIIKVLSRTASTTKDAAGKSVKTEVVKLAHIVFSYPSLGDNLDNQVCDTSFHVYLKINDPFKDLATKCETYRASKVK